MSAVDFTKPLATLLRDTTHETHDALANSAGAKLLLSGGLAKDEYARYLMMLWHVYDAFERALDQHANHPTLEPTYNPALLARAPSLAADISFILQVPESQWKSHPIHVALMTSMPSQLRAYVSRIEELANSADPSPLLAHSYVRYLGDLSGGQSIRHTLAKAYDLDEAAGFGISFYAFKELRSTKLAGQGEMKRIKDWFREGMNTGTNGDAQVKASVLQEANTAFGLNTGLFTSIRLRENKSVKTESKEIDIEAPQSVVPASRMGPTVSQVAAVILAVCLTHSLLVLGGFTGSQGYLKLLNLEHWMSTLWQQSPSE